MVDLKLVLDRECGIIELIIHEGIEQYVLIAVLIALGVHRFGNDISRHLCSVIALLIPSHLV